MAFAILKINSLITLFPHSPKEDTLYPQHERLLALSTITNLEIFSLFLVAPSSSHPTPLLSPHVAWTRNLAIFASFSRMYIDIFFEIIVRSSFTYEKNLYTLATWKPPNARFLIYTFLAFLLLFFQILFKNLFRDMRKAHYRY